MENVSKKRRGSVGLIDRGGGDSAIRGRPKPGPGKPHWPPHFLGWKPGARGGSPGIEGHLQGWLRENAARDDDQPRRRPRAPLRRSSLADDERSYAASRHNHHHGAHGLGAKSTAKARQDTTGVTDDRRPNTHTTTQTTPSKPSHGGLLHLLRRPRPREVRWNESAVCFVLCCSGSPKVDERCSAPPPQHQTTPINHNRPHDSAAAKESGQGVRTFAAAAAAANSPVTLPDLPYGYGELEPTIAGGASRARVPAPGTGTAVGKSD